MVVPKVENEFLLLWEAEYETVQLLIHNLISH